MFCYYPSKLFLYFEWSVHKKAVHSIFQHDLPQDPNGFILEEATPRPQRSRTLGIAELPTVQVCVHG